ncbi:histidine kinase [Candidatus Mycobacterium wuenschmannii]|uniref:histidine kinase n=2 Tax=Candidatus Mycobacterium wuenschmannii TaxID=3027808 RepID=A0ABY8VRS2_9MYCO|nr:histidine kinase [Candidatus Mycobacterium wuenschmannii]
MTRAVEYARSWFRSREGLIPDQYSWLFVMMIQACLVLTLIGSTLQRDRADLPVSAAAASLALVQLALFVVAAVRISPPLVGVTWWASSALLLFATSTPISVDLAPLLLVLMVGCVASLTRQRWAAASFVAAVALLAAATATHRLDGVALYLGFVALGWLMGYQMRRQHQLLVSQRELQADLAEHAAADERRRIAREVHDVIAHSLSVTMLHVTGARHALQQDGDIDDAVGALVDAERLGRQAMADIRRTVDLLEASPTRLAPEPGVADIPGLVDDFVSAGLPVTLRSEGQTEQVSAAVGLALYRIAQESLANIAKHAATSTTDVGLSISSTSASLTVINEAPAPEPVALSQHDGRGLVGMRQRVELLGGVLDAGPCRQGWSVRAEIPLGEANSWRCGR